MEGDVTWPQLYFIFGISAAVVSACSYVVYRVCDKVAQIETRLTKLEGKK